MEKIPFGKTGVSVSPISLGCMLMGSSTDEATSIAILDRYVEAGGDFLDTADAYAWWIGKGEFVGDESEFLLGRWMKSRGNRGRIFLASKVGARPKDPKRLRDADGNVDWDRERTAHEYLAPGTIHRAIEGSLRRLGTDHLDLYYAHIDDRATPLEETLETFNELVKSGKVRFIACSNHRTWRLERARQISAAHGWAAYVAVQQQYSYLRPNPGADFGVGVSADDELLDYLRANEDVTLLPYSPLLKGIYDDAKKREAYYAWPSFKGADAAARLAVLTEMAKELGVTNSQLVLAWMFNQRPRPIPIVGASSVAQLEQNLKALDLRLDDAQMSRLSAASA